MDENSWNPWTGKCLEDFLFYCCPECDLKNRERSIFHHHVLNMHPMAKDLFCDTVKKEDEFNASVKTESVNQSIVNKTSENEVSSDVKQSKWKDSVEEIIEKVENVEENNSTSKELVCCTLCDYTTKSAKLFERHMRSHKQCLECGKVFSGQNASRLYKMHMKNKHLTKKPKQKILHKCEDCHTTFDFKSYLVRHQKISLCQRKRENSIKSVIKQEQLDDTFDYELMNTEVTNDEYDSIENQEFVNNEAIDKPRIQDSIVYDTRRRVL